MLTNCSHFSSQGSYYGYTQTWTKLHTEVMNWISGANYECRLCMALTSSDLNYTVRNLYRLWVACPCPSRSAVAMRALTWVVFTLSFFHADSAFWQYSPSPIARWARDHPAEDSLREIFKCAHLKFTVYGRKQANKQANKQAYTHFHMQSR